MRDEEGAALVLGQGINLDLDLETVREDHGLVGDPIVNMTTVVD